MEIQVGDILVMKKPHPCGVARWLVLRTRRGPAPALHRLRP